MTTIIEAEPELQPQGASPPPSTPQRTAVGTDDAEKPPCKHCGHTKTDHLASSPGCRALISTQFPPEPGSLYNVNLSLNTSMCGCPRYEPKEH